MNVAEELTNDREARFLQGVSAFIRRDFRRLEAAMHPDIVMHVPGRSWLAGTYRGLEGVSRCIVGMRQVLESNRDDVSYLHEAERMVVTHRIALHGPMHHIDMTFLVGISYDADERVTAVSVEPEDLGLFDHVVNTARQASEGPSSVGT